MKTLLTSFKFLLTSYTNTQNQNLKISPGPAGKLAGLSVLTGLLHGVLNGPLDQLLLFHAILFSNVGIPYIDVMIALMVQLKDTSGTIVLFETIGGPPKSNHEERKSIPRTILKT